MPVIRMAGSELHGDAAGSGSPCSRRADHNELVVPSAADAERIAALINRRSQALRGFTEESTEGVREWFALPTINPRTDMRLAVSAAGDAKGWADVTTRGDDVAKVWVDLRALEECQDALALLFVWAEERAAELVCAGGRILYVLEEQERVLRSLLATAGYSTGRSFLTMERSLTGVLDTPLWPSGVVAQPFDRSDAEALHAAQEEAFADDWYHDRQTFSEWKAINLGADADSSLWRVVRDGSEIAGFCLNRPRRGEDETVGWIDVLGVRRSWRRTGIGEALLRESFRLFAAAGKLTAGLGVDAENPAGAVSLYKSVGMRVVDRRETWERSV